MTPILLGVAIYGFICQIGFNNIKSYIIPLFYVSCIGIIINYFVIYPWEGVSYAMGDIDIEMSRYWTAEGIRRLAGFSRASYMAASQVLLLSVYLMVFLKNYYYKLFIWLIAGVVIILTTTKGLMLTYALLSIIFIFKKITIKIYNIYVSLAVFLIVVMLPVGSTIFSIESNQLMPQVFNSFLQRISYIWPLTMEMINNQGSISFGRGVGGIGIAQKYFEPLRYSPGDNIFIYLYSLFGITAIFYLAFLLCRSRLLKPKLHKVDEYIYVLLISILTFGITANVLENTYFAFGSGILIAHIHSLNPKFDYKIVLQNILYAKS
ncbi:hypothetical protein [Desulforamulus aquiferis]|uniref:hypothetical protein n=1 Tax=Desulforamulus aquiferis TaxID=1397668 RepID=UPI00271474CE|nr:hypothetical protein [Desulforamulus aquiferis]